MPKGALVDNGLDPANFRDYPECNGPGFWAGTENSAAQKNWSVRPRVEVGSDFDGLESTGLGLQLEHANRLGLGATWNRFREDLPGGATDELDLTDANFVVRFAQSARIAFRSGIGLNSSDDSSEQNFGFNFACAAEFLPAPHVSIRLECAFGTLGNATRIHGRASAGWVIGRLELFASWDSWSLDDGDLLSFGAGLRAWL